MTAVEPFSRATISLVKDAAHTIDLDQGSDDASGIYTSSQSRQTGSRKPQKDDRNRRRSGLLKARRLKVPMR